MFYKFKDGTEWKQNPVIENLLRLLDFLDISNILNTVELTMPDNTTVTHNHMLVEPFVRRIAEFLTAYKKIAEDKGLERFFDFIRPIGEFAKPLSEALKELKREKWEDDNFYRRLTEAIDSVDKADDGKPADDTSPGGGNLWKYLLIGFSILFLLVIIGVVIHLAMKKKKLVIILHRSTTHVERKDFSEMHLIIIY